MSQESAFEMPLRTYGSGRDAFRANELAGVMSFLTRKGHNRAQRAN